MKQTCLVLFLSVFFCIAKAGADTVILRDGASYTGQFTSAKNGEIGFTDG